MMMNYKRSMLRGFSGPIHDLLAKQLGIKTKGRRHGHMAKGGGRFDAFKRRLAGKGYAQGSGKGKGGKMSAIERRKQMKNDNDGDE